MATIYYDEDCKLENIKDKVVGIIGYGSQGHAQAQNLRDSGINVLIAEVPGGRGWKAAKEAKFKVMEAREMASKADIIMMLAPDTAQAKIYT